MKDKLCSYCNISSEPSNFANTCQNIFQIGKVLVQFLLWVLIWTIVGTTSTQNERKASGTFLQNHFLARGVMKCQIVFCLNFQQTRSLVIRQASAIYSSFNPISPKLKWSKLWVWLIAEYKPIPNAATKL